jgi:hypothetical protein
MEENHKTIFMKNINSQVSEILKKNKSKYMFEYSDAHECNVAHDNHNDEHIIIECNKMITKCTYEYLGTHDTTTNTWLWAWGYTMTTKKTELSKKIVKKMKKIIDEKNNKVAQIDIEYLNFFIQNSIFLSKLNLNKLIKICIGLLEDDIVWIVPQVQKKQINFFIITKIIQTEQ